MGETDAVDLIIRGGTLLTMDPEGRLVEGGSVAVSGSKIVAILDKGEDLSRFSAKAVIDARGKLVMPGLINAHRHFYSTPRGLIANRVTRNALKEYVYPYYHAIPPEQLYYDALAIMAEMIRTGTTCFSEPGCEHIETVLRATEKSGMRATTGLWIWDHGGPDADKCFSEPGCEHIETVLRATEKSGMRATTGLWIWDHGGPDADKCPPDFLPLKTDEALRMMEDAIIRYDGALDGRLTVHATIEGAGTCSDELTVGSKVLAEQYGKLSILHKSTSIEEVEIELKAFGHRPTEHLYHIGALGPNVLLNHATAIDETEVGMIAETGTRICQNPSAALKLGKGTTQTGKFAELSEAGTPICLGTDSNNSSNFNDMFREVYLAAVLPKDSRMDPSVMTAEKALLMGTREGADALLMGEEIGSLEAGKKADVILLDMERIEFALGGDIIDTLVYSATGDAVETVIVDGTVLMEKRELKTIDEEEAFRKIQENAVKGMDRMNVSPASRWPIL